MVETEHLEIDEDDNEETITVEVSVIELILSEIERDELYFDDDILKKIYDEFKAGLDRGELLGESYFLRHTDPEISKAAVDIITNRYEISPNWIVKKVYTTSEIEKLELAVKQSIYSYKSSKIRKQKDHIQKEIAKLNQLDADANIDEIMTLLAQQKKLDMVIGKLTNNDSLGRVIH